MTTTTPRPSLNEIVARRTGAPAAPAREYATRKPTGATTHPLMLLAGGPKVGKSFAIAAASRDERVARVTVVEVGNDDGALDGYGKINGADFELVAHDGTAGDVLAAIAQAAAQPPAPGGVNILAIDGATSLWRLMSRQAHRGSRDIGPGGWASLNGTWDDLLATLRTHAGPVILTARTDDATTDDDLGRVRVQKDLAFDVDVVVQATSHRDFTLTGARSVALADLDDARLPLHLGDLDIPELLDLLGSTR